MSFPHPALKTAHRAAQGRVWFFSPKTSLPLPLKGEGLGIVFPGLVGFALLVHNGATAAQQGLFGASLVSVPLPGSQSRTQRHTGAGLDFTVFSWCASFAAALPTGAPGGS